MFDACWSAGGDVEGGAVSTPQPRVLRARSGVAWERLVGRSGNVRDMSFDSHHATLDALPNAPEDTRGFSPKIVAGAWRHSSSLLERQGCGE